MARSSRNTKAKASKASATTPKAKKPGSKQTTTPTTKSKDPKTDGKSCIGKRVSKNFDGEIYNGTVKRYIAKHKLWAIRYDDGDAEEMDWEDLKNAMDLHDGGDGKEEEGGGGETKERMEGEEQGGEQMVIDDVDASHDKEGLTKEDDEGGDKEMGTNEDERGEEAKKDITPAASPPPQAQDAGKSPPPQSSEKNGVDMEKKERQSLDNDAAAGTSSSPTLPPKDATATANDNDPNDDAATEKNPSAQRNFGKVNQPIHFDDMLFLRNPCRIPGGTSRHPTAYPNYRKGKGSFGFLIQRLSDRNYAMRSLCLDRSGATYNTYKKKGVNYISVVWYPPSNLNDHADDDTIVDGCHLDLIDPNNGRTYLDGPNLISAIRNAVNHVRCVFLNGAQSNPGSDIGAGDIAAAIDACSDSLLCLSLTECKLSAGLLRSITGCQKLRGIIIENCQLWGGGEEGQDDERPTDVMLAETLRACPELRWCFVKSSIFGTECWNALEDCKNVCPHLEVLWVDAPLHTEERIDVARGDHDTIRRALESRRDVLKICMINPDDKNESRYVLNGNGAGGGDRLEGRKKTEEEKRMTHTLRGGSYLNTV